MKKLILLTTFIAFCFAGVKLGLRMYLNTAVKNQSQVVLDIKKGSGLTKVSYQLVKLGVIENPKVFIKIGQLQGYGGKIKYGEYLIDENITYQDVLDKIVSGDNLKYTITFVEGDHYYKYAKLLEDKKLTSKEEFIRLVRDQQFIKKMLGHSARSLEGYLFPETYQFSKNDGVRTIVKTMVKNFFKKTKNLNFSSQKMTRHQLVTLASIIEKETGAAHERPLISSVFHNRLKKKMRLQTDPTILYGIMDKTGQETNNIRKKDILAPTAYNTYVIKGLPPGPIANPGLASIQAALNPESSDFLYFVSQNNGTHIFTKTYKEHSRAVNKFQRNPKMRKNKSWRDLKNKK